MAPSTPCGHQSRSRQTLWRLRRIGNFAGVTAVARALSRNDVVHAQIAALLLGIPDPPAEDAREQELIKFNPFHDARGRFTTADGAVEPSGERADAPDGREAASDHSGRTKPDKGGPTPEGSATGSAGKQTAGATPAAVMVQGCGDAFRACVQIAAFQRPGMISNCIAALRTCRSTGLPTIFGPGIVGKQ